MAVLGYNGVGLILYAVLLLAVLTIVIRPNASTRYLTIVALLAAVRVADYCVLLFLQPEGATESYVTAWCNVLTMSLLYGALLEGVIGPLSTVVRTTWASAVRVALRILTGAWGTLALLWGVGASLCAAGDAACPFVSARDSPQREVRSGFFRVQHIMLATISAVSLLLLAALLVSALRLRTRRNVFFVPVECGNGGDDRRAAARVAWRDSDAALVIWLSLAILSCALRIVVDLEANVAGGSVHSWGRGGTVWTIALIWVPELVPIIALGVVAGAVARHEPAPLAAQRL